MAKYHENFNFQMRDIELIENAIRNEISRVAALSAINGSVETDASLARELNQLLAKIYHQKVFYSQVHNTGVPGG
ncbi:MAG: hypothetical protein ACREPG_13060 [Candidatus Binatia bacterium]